MCLARVWMPVPAVKCSLSLALFSCDLAAPQATHTHTHIPTRSNKCIQNCSCAHIHTHTPHDQMKRNHCSASQALLTHRHTILLLQCHLWNHQSHPCFNILWATCFLMLPESVNTQPLCARGCKLPLLCMCVQYNRSQSCLTQKHTETWCTKTTPPAFYLVVCSRLRSVIRPHRAVRLWQAVTVAGH